MIFWLFAAALVGCCVAVLLWPMARRVQRGASREDFDLTVYKDQLQELGKDRERGLIDGAEAEAAEAEIARRILAIKEGQRIEIENGKSPLPTRIAAVAVAVILSLGSLAIYVELGNPGLRGLPLAERGINPSQIETGQIETGQIETGQNGNQRQDLIDQVRTRLSANPNDGAAWLILARLHRDGAAFDEAIEAYRRANELLPGQPLILVELAESLVATNGGEVVIEARRLFASVLEAEPNSPIALYYAGLALAQDGQLQKAYDLWTILASASPADAPWMPVLSQQIARLEAALSGNAAQPQEPDAQNQAEPQNQAEQGQMIREMVERLASRLEEDPNDLEGWIMLMRSYRVLGDQEGFNNAAAKAGDLAKNLPSDDPLRQRFEEELGGP